MIIYDRAAGIEHEATIKELTTDDISRIKKSTAFRFDWAMEKSGVVYKLVLKGRTKILGLICLVDHGAGTDATEIKLIEIGKENVGRHKQFLYIAECLIAFACRRSISSGHGGWVFLKPKTELVSHYRKKYGFVQTGFFMSLEPKTAMELIHKYL